MSAVLKPASRPVSSRRLDHAAICVSAACLAHCLAVPILLVLAPWLSLGALGEEWLHLTMVVLIVPLSLIAFRLGYRRNAPRRVLVPGLTGLTLVVLAAVLEATHAVGHDLAAGMTSVGGVALIIGHWRNLRSGSCVGLHS